MPTIIDIQPQPLAAGGLDKARPVESRDLAAFALREMPGEHGGVGVELFQVLAQLSEGAALEGKEGGEEQGAHGVISRRPRCAMLSHSSRPVSFEI
jgi:hypothetical protein